jgi:hypothetical protein
VVTNAARPWIPIRSLTRSLSGIVPVGLNAVWLVSGT